MQEKKHNPYYQALAIVSRRDHSVHEMRVKLKRRGFTIEQVTATIAKLKEESLLDDERFAKVFIESVLERKAVGSRWLRAKLRQRGIEQTIIDHTLAEQLDSGNEEKVLEQAARQWQRRHQQVRHEYARLARFLVSRGFSQGAIAALREQLQTTSDQETSTQL